MKQRGSELTTLSRLRLYTNELNRTPSTFRDRFTFHAALPSDCRGDRGTLRHESVFALSVKHYSKKRLKPGGKQKRKLFRIKQGKKINNNTEQAWHNTRKKELTKPRQVETSSA